MWDEDFTKHQIQTKDIFVVDGRGNGSDQDVKTETFTETFCFILNKK